MRFGSIREWLLANSLSLRVQRIYFKASEKAIFAQVWAVYIQDGNSADVSCGEMFPDDSSGIIIFSMDARSLRSGAK
jgi:hypothetical protein